MEKLQPIIRHHFWILFVIALILPPIAWSMTSGSLDEATQTRVDDLDKTLSGVAPGMNAANGDWTNAATQLVNVRKESNRRAWNRLWDVQEELQIWPATVRPYMEKCPYRGTPADLPDTSPADAARVMAAVPNLFRGDYEREVQRVWQIPEPIDEQNGLKAAENAPQKVLFPSTVLPRVPQAKWRAAQPTWKEMWNAQEDLWLMSELLKAITRTNADAGSIADANVRQIQRIQLFGGERAAAGSSGGGGGTDGGMSGSDPSAMGSMSGMGAAYGRATSSAGSPAPAEFALAEEYTVKDAPAGGGGSSSYGSMMSSGSMSNPTDGAMSGGGADAGSDPQADENRYIKHEAAFRTRGFKLQLTVHQMYVPMLISELLKSEFPLEVVRIQQSAINPDRPGSNRAGSFGGRGLASAGPGYGGPGGYGAGGSASPEDIFGSGAEASLGNPEESFSGYGNEGGEPGDFDSFGGVGGTTGGAAAANNAVNSAVVTAALSDVNLMDVVVVGEIYLYNKPDPAEAGEEPAAGTEQPIGTDAATNPAAVDPAGALPTTDAAIGNPAAGLDPAAAQPGAAVPAGNPAALTGEVAPPAGNAPATLGTTVIPADTPAGQTPPAPTAGSPASPAGTPQPSDNPPPAAGVEPPASSPQPQQ
jgi:hypothetical protein